MTFESQAKVMCFIFGPVFRVEDYLNRVAELIGLVIANAFN